MPAVALTDQSNLFAMVKFYRAAQAAGVKPIVGVDLLRARDRRASEPHALVLLCQNEAGYRNLTRLRQPLPTSKASSEGTRLIERSWLDAPTRSRA